MTPIWLTASLILANVGALAFGQIRATLLSRRVARLEEQLRFEQRVKENGFRVRA